MKDNTTRYCSQCRSPLILISTVTELVEGSRHPQTTTTYTCSNTPCQEEKDKQTAKRLKLQRDKALIDKKRAEARSQLKLQKNTEHTLKSI